MLLVDCAWQSAAVLSMRLGSVQQSSALFSCSGGCTVALATCAPLPSPPPLAQEEPYWEEALQFTREHVLQVGACSGLGSPAAGWSPVLGVDALRTSVGVQLPAPPGCQYCSWCLECAWNGMPHLQGRNLAVHPPYSTGRSVMWRWRWPAWTVPATSRARCAWASSTWEVRAGGHSWGASPRQWSGCKPKAVATRKVSGHVQARRKGLWGCALSEQPCLASSQCCLPSLLVQWRFWRRAWPSCTPPSTPTAPPAAASWRRRRPRRAQPSSRWGCVGAQ